MSANLALAGRLGIVRIARRYPRLCLLLDHIGIAHREKALEALARLDDILTLSSESNIAVRPRHRLAYSHGSDRHHPYPDPVGDRGR
jgi:hypothetical protein